MRCDLSRTLPGRFVFESSFFGKNQKPKPFDSSSFLGLAQGRLNSQKRRDMGHPRIVSAPREIPRPAGKNAGLRDDAFQRGLVGTTEVVPFPVVLV
jgi:hypothetical protein